MIAENIARSGCYSPDGENPTALRPPAYRLFLAAMALGGTGWTTFALIGQSALAGICLALTALLAHRIFANLLTTVSSPVLVLRRIDRLRGSPVAVA